MQPFDTVVAIAGCIDVSINRYSSHRYCLLSDVEHVLSDLTAVFYIPESIRIIPAQQG